MAQGSECDFRLLLSFNSSTSSEMNPKNRDLNGFEHAIVFAHNRND